jgi:hypothetical protein
MIILTAVLILGYTTGMTLWYNTSLEQHFIRQDILSIKCSCNLQLLELNMTGSEFSTAAITSFNTFNWK